MRILNLGILAHVDAGKTTLTERLLYSAGVIDRPGSVDEGSSHTDFLPLERERGITIKSAVASFHIGAIRVNLIDTPGHPDFIAEVERVLDVLDGAVLLVSAVEGVQPQTKLLMRTLRRMSVPTVIFVNKIDRPGARREELVLEIADRLHPSVVALGTARHMGTREAEFVPFDFADSTFRDCLATALADVDESFLEAYADHEQEFSGGRLFEELRRLTVQSAIHPILFGSALTGNGVDALAAALEEFLPARCGNPQAPLQGRIFKVERGPAGEQVAFARIFAGSVTTRDRIRFGTAGEGKVTAIRVFDLGTCPQRTTGGAGEIAKLYGLGGVRIGDILGSDAQHADEHYFDPPTLETVIVPTKPEQKAALHSALQQLAEQDPLIGLRQDDSRGEVYVSVYGEVQKQVIQATLALEFDVEAEFRETAPICVERPAGSGEAVEELGNGSPFLATIGFRVDPAPVNAGVDFRLEAELITIPLYVYRSVTEFEQSMFEYVRDTLSQGLFGWRVADCLVTMTAAGYAAPATGARDFRLLTPLVLMTALQRAGTVVCQPVNSVAIEMPQDAYPPVSSLLGRLGGSISDVEVRGSAMMVSGSVPSVRLQDFRQKLPGVTHGEAVLEVDFLGYSPAPEPVPVRPRSDNNPLNRREYLLRLTGRI